MVIARYEITWVDAPRELHFPGLLAVTNEKGFCVLDLELLFRPDLANFANGWAVSDMQIPLALPGKRIGQANFFRDGFSASIDRLVDERTTIIVLSNVGPAAVPSIRDGLINILHDRSYAVP